MRRALAITCLLGSGSAARADVETREGQQRELGLPSRFDISTGGLRWQAFAQLAGGGAARRGVDTEAEGNVAVGTELRVVDDACDLVRLGGQARLAWSGTANPSAEQWASGCLAIGPTIMELGHHLEWDVRPSLLAPLRLRPGENRRETATFRWQPVRLPLAAFASPAERVSWPTGDLVIFDVNVAWSFLWSKAGSVADHAVAEAVPFRYVRERTAAWGERRDVTVDVGVGGGEFAGDAVAVRVWLARLQNYELGPVLASVGLGIASASAGPLISDVMREVDITTPRALLGFEAGTRYVHGHVRFTHDAEIAPDGYATVDTRVAGGVSVDLARTRVGLDAMLGRTAVHVPRFMPVTDATGGVSLSLAHGLGAHLEATLQLDVARSFYAPEVELATGAVPSPRRAVQALGTLQARLGR